MSNTIKESELAALAPDKTIAKLRALDNTGASVSITPAQAATAIAEPLATPLAPILAPIIAPMLGLDHTLLTEQIVPGEKWVDFDGVRRQVLTSTIMVVFPSGYTADAKGQVLTSVPYGIEDVKSLISVVGCRCDNDFLTNDYAWQDAILTVMTPRLRGKGWGRFVGFYGESYPKPCTVIIALKYTRA